MTGPEAFAITATLATASAVVGWLIARWLRTHAHRYADEADLERRTHAWVPVVSALVLPLPDRFTKPLVPASVLGTGLVALVTGSGGDWVRGVLGGVVLGVVYLVLALLGRGTGLGLGDVKLAPSLGVLLAFHGWAAMVLASVLAFVSAGVFGLVLIALRRADRRSTLAFGPHMIGAAMLVLAAPGLGWVVGLSSSG